MILFASKGVCENRLFREIRVALASLLYKKSSNKTINSLYIICYGIATLVDDYTNMDQRFIQISGEVVYTVVRGEC